MPKARVALIAGAGGLAVGGAVIAILALHKKRQIEAMVKNVRSSVAGNERAQTQLARDAAAMKTRLESFAKAEATRVAAETAETYLRTQYGITPDRIAAISRLADRFG